MDSWFCGFVIDHAWISKLLRDVAFSWRPKELSCRLKRVTYFGEFGYLNSSCIRKLLFQSVFETYSVADVSVGFRSSCWRPPWWAPLHQHGARLHWNLYRFGSKNYLDISLKKNCCELNLGESLWIFTLSLFPDSGLTLLNGFDFYFDTAWHWTPGI